MNLLQDIVLTYDENCCTFNVQTPEPDESSFLYFYCPERIYEIDVSTVVFTSVLAYVNDVFIGQYFSPGYDNNFQFNCVEPYTASDIIKIRFRVFLTEAIPECDGLTTFRPQIDKEFVPVCDCTINLNDSLNISNNLSCVSGCSDGDLTIFTAESSFNFDSTSGNFTSPLFTGVCTELPPFESLDNKLYTLEVFDGTTYYVIYKNTLAPNLSLYNITCNDIFSYFDTENDGYPNILYDILTNGAQLRFSVRWRFTEPVEFCGVETTSFCETSEYILECNECECAEDEELVSLTNNPEDGTVCRRVLEIPPEENGSCPFPFFRVITNNKICRYVEFLPFSSCTTPCECPEGYDLFISSLDGEFSCRKINLFGPVFETEDCLSDIIFIVDVSGSVVQGDMIDIKAFLTSIVTSLSPAIENGDVKVGIVTFSQYVFGSPITPGILGGPGATGGIIAAISALPLAGAGSTNVNSGHCAAKLMFDTYARPGVQKKTVLLTDAETWQLSPQGSICTTVFNATCFPCVTSDFTFTRNEIISEDWEQTVIYVRGPDFSDYNILNTSPTNGGNGYNVPTYSQLDQIAESLSGGICDTTAECTDGSYYDPVSQRCIQVEFTDIICPEPPGPPEPPEPPCPPICIKEDFREVDVIKCGYIASTCVRRNPRYGEYGNTYPRNCDECLYYYETETGVPSWTSEKEKAKIFPNLEIAEFLQKIFTQLSIDFEYVQTTK